MALSQDELFKLDLYDLLGLEIKCSLQDVKRAFRKKALKCHPDKNPDDPNAAQLFHQLSCALEILSDESARAAYDKVLNGRKAAQIRNQQLDSRRKKLKEDLEERERNVRSEPNFRSEEMKLKVEIERLRKEGSRLLREEINKVQEQIKSFDYTKSKSKKYENNESDSLGSKCLTIRWKAEKGDADNGGYNHTVLHNLLSKFGELTALVVSPKRRGRAVVEFKTLNAAMKVLETEIGLPNNPLIIELVEGSESSQRDTAAHGDSQRREQEDSSKKSSVFPSFAYVNNQMRADVFSAKMSLGKSSSPSNDEMLESTVLQRLRHMEHMKRAAAEISEDK